MIVLLAALAVAAPAVADAESTASRKPRIESLETRRDGEMLGVSFRVANGLTDMGIVPGDHEVLAADLQHALN